MTKGMRKYFKKKIFWFVITFIAAVILNFILPRLMPGDPVNSIVGKNISPGATQEQVQEQIAYYQHQFGLDKDIFGQFWDFVKNAKLYGYLKRKNVRNVPSPPRKLSFEI